MAELPGRLALQNLARQISSLFPGRTLGGNMSSPWIRDFWQNGDITKKTGCVLCISDFHILVLINNFWSSGMLSDTNPSFIPMVQQWSNIWLYPVRDLASQEQAGVWVGQIMLLSVPSFKMILVTGVISQHIRPVSTSSMILPILRWWAQGQRR